MPKLEHPPKKGVFKSSTLSRSYWSALQYLMFCFNFDAWKKIKIITCSTPTKINIAPETQGVEDEFISECKFLVIPKVGWFARFTGIFLPGKLRANPLKIDETGRWSFPFGLVHFEGPTVKLQVNPLEEDAFLSFGARPNWNKGRCEILVEVYASNNSPMESKQGMMFQGKSLKNHP